ncbi:hypothetical protein EHF33_15520 [Deinococcus psychrotolerans]|uniref:Uncharacterized protein n=1 Tax=Deinococcus psychrotolerans TaxID=2489213 RepID=A0A3G8YJ36_9DEIO|nr:hypothetical protein [Deinococcus psychrotolerans]AZI44297.1 hypothetical protein EHF33_15520 [Deinococcus psychrotolerans]
MNPPPTSTPKPPNPKAAPPAKPRHKAKHTPQYVLVMTDTDNTLSDKKGHVQTVTPDTLASLKLRGTVHVVDLTGLADITFTPAPGLTPQQASSAIALSPETYLPAHVAEDAIFGVLPTIDDQGENAALITYTSKQAMGDLTRALSAAGLSLLSVENAALTALHRLPKQGGGAIITSTEHQHVALIANDTRIIGRIRQPASQQIGERLDQLFDMLTSITSILHGQNTSLDHIILIADPESAQRLHDETMHGTPDFTLDILTQSDLAQLGFLAPTLPLKPGKQTSTVQRGDLKAYLPLAIGLAVAVLPFLALTLLNQATQRQISGDQVALTALSAPLNEYAALNTSIARGQAAQQQVNTILSNRVNWPQKLTALTDQLPTQNGAFTVKLQTLQATAIQSAPPPPPTASVPPTPGGTPVPISAPLTLPAPTITYTLTAQATNKAAINDAINTLESRYALNLTTLRKTLPTTAQQGVWVMQATATEKPTLNPQGAAQ